MVGFQIFVGETFLHSPLALDCVTEGFIRWLALFPILQHLALRCRTVIHSWHIALAEWYRLFVEGEVDFGIDIEKVMPLWDVLE